MANVTGKDVRNFLNAAAQKPIYRYVEEYPFSKANKAIMDIRNRKIKGAKVLLVGK